MKLVGANAAPHVAGREELPGKSNYFRGSDPNKWRTNVPNYAKVEYDDVYPGVNLVYYGNQRQLEYDLIVAPGADPKIIALDFEGADKVKIDRHGDLVLKSKGGELRLHKPELYQQIGETRVPVEGKYTLQRKVASRPGLNLKSAIRNPQSPSVFRWRLTIRASR